MYTLTAVHDTYSHTYYLPLSRSCACRQERTSTKRPVKTGVLHDTCRIAAAANSVRSIGKDRSRSWPAACLPDSGAAQVLVPGGEKDVETSGARSPPGVTGSCAPIDFTRLVWLNQIINRLSLKYSNDRVCVFSKYVRQIDNRKLDHRDSRELDIVEHEWFREHLRCAFFFLPVIRSEGRSWCRNHTLE